MKRLGLLTLLIAAWSPLVAQVKCHVFTDSLTYHYGDSIHVTISAVNIGSEPDTLWLTTCDAGYFIDNSRLFAYHPCDLVESPYVIQPHDSLRWTLLPLYPVNKDTLTVGKHAVVGEFVGYGFSDTLWVTVTTVNAVEEKPATPQGYALENSYPDPFNPSTTIGYRLPVRSHVALLIFDVLGRKVATLVDRQQNAGAYSVSFDAGGLPSGVYFDRLEAGRFIQTRKFLLLK